MHNQCWAAMGPAIIAMSLVTTSSTVYAGVQAKRFGDDNSIIGTNKLNEKMAAI